MTLLELMDSRQNDYAKAEKKVYELIRQNPDLVRDATITLLASSADTSTSAVLRFTQTLGFKGFKDFRFAFINELNQQPHTEGHDDVLNSYDALIGELKQIDQEIIKNLVKTIKQSHAVFLTGFHYTSIPVRRLQYTLEDAGILSLSAHDSIHENHLASLMNSDDCLITFSVKGNLKDHRGLIDALSGMKLRDSYLITNNPRHTIGQYYQHVIVLPAIPGHSYYHMQETIMMIFIDMLASYLYQG